MKRIVYLLTVVAIVISGCNPMDDIYNDIDAQPNPVVGTDEFTMTSDDYADLLDADEDEEDFYEMFEAFADLDDAKNTLPSFIAGKYPFWGNGSAVTVNFDIYDGNPGDLVAPYSNADVYVLGTSDYPTFNSNAFLQGENIESTLEDILDDQFSMAEEGQVVRFGYEQYTEAPEVGLTNVFAADFFGDFDGFELVTIDDPADLGWETDNDQIVGTGWNGMANPSEEWLVSPQIDLSGQSGLFFQITQEIDFLNTDSLIDILVSTDYEGDGDVESAEWIALDFDKSAFGSMTTSEDYDFSDYDGEQIYIALKYSSTADESPRWRVQNLAVRTIGFEGPTQEMSSYYVFFDGSWDETNDNVYYLTTEDYDSMGAPGQFNNFSGSVAPQDYLPQFLGMQFPFAQEEDEIYMIYRFFGGSGVGTVTRGNLYTFTNGVWVPSISTLQFGNENGVWVPDNTIRYALVGSDYSLIVNELTGVEGFEAAVENLDQFGNFNRTGGSTNWTDEMVITALNIVLDNINPSAEDGQKYIITIATWAPGNSTEEWAMIKNEGEWVLQSE